MSAERVFFLGKPPPPDTPPRDYREAMSRTGYNTGNMFFMDALRRQLRYTSIEFGYDFDPKAVSQNYDYIAVPAANWIAAGNKMPGRVAKLIEQTNLPCLVAGLGAQSLQMRTVARLGDDVQRFLKLISERCKVIGVRGPYTLRVLEHYGIENAVIAGCPSYFWGLKPSLQTKPKTREPAVAVNGSRDRTIGPSLNDKKRDVEKELYRYAFDNDGSFTVAQTEKFEIHMGVGAELAAIPNEHVESFRQFFDAEMRDEEIERLRAKFRVFTSITNWMAELSKVDFVIGTRLHGCLMGIAAGVPTLLISIDSRTRELAEYLKVPTVPLEDLEVPLDINKLYAQVEMGETLRAYPRLFGVYREFLEANGVSHNMMPDQRSQMPGRGDHPSEPELAHVDR